MATDVTTLPGTWNLDTVHSSAHFSVKHMVVAKFRGHFDEFGAQLVDGVLTGTVKVDSLVVKDENLKGHLLTDDFFNAEAYPEITFKSTSIDVEGEDVTVQGDLTIKGQTVPVTGKGELSGPGTDIAGSEKLGISLETTVDRTQFGLNWNADLPKGGKALGNDVKVTVDLELVKA
jgi:polyisoprenoid-binding protein YceI